MRPMLALIAAIAIAAPAGAQEDHPRAGEGAELFQDYCATCHGADARGGGPMHPVLTVEAPDLTRLAAERGGFPHADVVRKIDGRDPLVSHGSDMPVWGPYFDGEGGVVRTDSGRPIPTSGAIEALVSWLETVQEP